MRDIHYRPEVAPARTLQHVHTHIGISHSLPIDDFHSPYAVGFRIGFETGAFNDGSTNASWQQFEGGGIQTITTSNPSSGTFAANLVVPVRGGADPAVDNLIKNANLQAGNLTPGASITVSFDMRGSLSGAGGVVFAEFFSELSGGGTSKAEIFTGGPLTPDPDWTSYSFNTTLGPDVSGGVTLQLKASCGPVPGCGVDVFFDNVSITTQ